MFSTKTTYDRIISTEVLTIDQDKQTLGLPSQEWRRFALRLSEVANCEEVFAADEIEFEGTYTLIRMRSGDEHIINVDFSQFLQLWTT
jgi:hypothetical protein